MRFLVSFLSPSRGLRSIAWRLDADSVPARRVTAPPRTGADTLVMRWDSPGSHSLTAVITDSSGHEWSSRIQVEILLDPPRIAGRNQDPVVSVGDTVAVSVSASDAFGSIVLREWDIGAKGDFKESSDGIGRFVAPDTEGYFPCVVRVTDDDGNRSVDTVWITVIADPPTAVLTSSPPEARAGEPFTLIGSESVDIMGRIVRWEWDIGNTGRFSSGPSDTQIVVASANPTFTCALRVTDDDGQMETVSLKVPVRPSGSWIRFSNESPMKENLNPICGSGLGKAWVYGEPNATVHWLRSSADMIHWDGVATTRNGSYDYLTDRFLEHQGKLWIIDQGAGRMAEVWSSTDGLEWDPVATPDSLRDRLNCASAVFQGKLWIMGGWNEAAEDLPDIWSSSDGVAWTKAAATPWSPRWDAKAAVAGGKLWVYGGKPIPYAFDSRPLNDLWSSADGISWSRVSDSVLPAGGPDKYLIGYGGELWILSSGLDPGSGEASVALWHSPDGKTWTQQALPPGLPASTRPGLVEVGGRLYLMTGDDGIPDPDEGSTWQAPKPSP